MVRKLLIGLAVVLVCGTQMGAAPKAKKKGLAYSSDAARHIDEMMAKRWKAAKVSPSKRATDAEFIRRVYLDVTGKIPPAMVTRKFIASQYSNKREQLVQRLLSSPNYVRHFTNVWRARLLPETEADFQLRYVSIEFDAWMRKKLLNNEPYDKIVRQIITVPLNGNGNRGAYAFYSGRNEARPTAFFSAKEIKPENLAAATARVFLGLRVDCAQCHDHPFASWKQENFWSYAAFFSGIRARNTGAGGIVRNLSEFFGVKKSGVRNVSIMIPDTKKVVQAGFLDGSKPTAKSLANPRAALADWIIKKNNPFFARAAVNRMWHHFHGVGIIDPVDDLGSTNEPSHPEVLDYLSKQFVKHNYDLKFLIEAITKTRAYQLSSVMTHPSQKDRRLFGRMTPKAMTSDQLYDSLAAAAGSNTENPSESMFFDSNTGSRRSRFRQLFGQVGDNPADRETSVMQALTLMNGRDVAQATTLGRSKTLFAVTNMPLMSVADRVEALYLASLSRYPTKKERAKMVGYVKKGGVRKSRRQALADVFWVLLNSSEFMLNH